MSTWRLIVVTKILSVIMRAQSHEDRITMGSSHVDYPYVSNRHVTIGSSGGEIIEIMLYIDKKEKKRKQKKEPKRNHKETVEKPWRVESSSLRAITESLQGVNDMCNFENMS